MFSSVRAFIEPDTSISNRILRGRGRRRKRPSRSTSPSLRTLSRKRTAQIGEGAAACAPAPVTAPPRQAGRRLARQPSQRVSGRIARKAALDQGFRARRGKAGFIGLVGERRLVLAAAFFLQANDLFVFAISLFDRFAAAEVEVEQPVIGRAPLRRWRQRREPGLADMFQAARPEQIDRCEECRGLLRRHGKSVGAQQRDKGDEDPDSARKCKFVAHAAASAISASSRGEM